MAEETTLASRRVLAAGEGYDLGWVTDWLYGDAAIPPAPLPQRTPSHRHLVPVHAEPPVFADAPAHRPTPARRRARGRRARQLALL